MTFPGNLQESVAFRTSRLAIPSCKLPSTDRCADQDRGPRVSGGTRRDQPGFGEAVERFGR